MSWYCRYQLSYRDVEEMMRERGLDVDHSTVFRWVQRYAPEINQRMRQHLRMSGASFRVDETYIRVRKTCKYLYRAVDKEGQPIEFMLSAKRDLSAAKRFFQLQTAACEIPEQRHRTGYRFIKKKARASQYFKRFRTAEQTLEGSESVNMMRKGQVKRLAGSNVRGEAKLVASLFGVAA